MKGERTKHTLPTSTMEQNLSDVSFSLAKHIISDEAKETNFVFSPLSIHVVLGLIASGSGGPTRESLLGFFKSNSTEELNTMLLNLVFSVFADGKPLGGPHVSIANDIWFDKSLTLKPSFREIVENVYKAGSNHVDFRNKDEEVRKEVNIWAKEKTNGLIKDLLLPGSVDSLTRRIFANAVYFKGHWQEPFDPENTKDDEFFLINGGSTKVPFMRSWDSQPIGVYDGFKVLRLPYVHSRDWKRQFSMYFYLPDDRHGLAALVEKAGSVSGFIDCHIPRGPMRLVRLQIPKFKIEFGFEVSEALESLGVVLGSGLTEMVDSGEDLGSSQFMQKAFIEVDECGTEAAAITIEESDECCGEVEEYVDFVADHPVMFVLREDESGAVLFIGQLFDPLVGNVAPN